MWLWILVRLGRSLLGIPDELRPFDAKADFLSWLLALPVGKRTKRALLSAWMIYNESRATKKDYTDSGFF